MCLRKVAVLFLGGCMIGFGAVPDVQTIIQNSVKANDRDFAAATRFDHKEEDRTASGSKTFEVLMLDGSPYRRLIQVNGKPLSPSQTQTEAAKEAQERRKRASESASQRRSRISKFQTERHRNQAMMAQLTEAFTFTLVGQCKQGNFDVYDLKATPKPNYRPPSMETQVLTGMQGELWIDTKSFQWVRVKAQVIHPVSIAGFLAQVEPGTEFELEKAPVSGDVWLASRFSMKADAKVMFLFDHNSQEEDAFWDYRPAQ